MTAASGIHAGADAACSAHPNAGLSGYTPHAPWSCISTSE